MPNASPHGWVYGGSWGRTPATGCGGLLASDTTVGGKDCSEAIGPRYDAVADFVSGIALRGGFSRTRREPLRNAQLATA